jgi:addiction module HigA family antidote
MLPTHRIPTHPGVILLEEFLEPLEIPQTLLAARIHVSVQRVNEIVKGKRGITADTAVRLAEFLRTSPEFWMNLQTQHDLAKVHLTDKIKPHVT